MVTFALCAPDTTRKRGNLYLPLTLLPSPCHHSPYLNMSVPGFPYDKAQDFIWDTYLKASKDEDEARPKNWEGSTTGILTFVRP